MPLFGDIARLLGQQGGAAWDGARQLAVSVATEGTSESNVDPMERMRIEQLARVADLRVADATGLSTSAGGRAVSVQPAIMSAQFAPPRDQAERNFFDTPWPGIAS